MWDDSVFGWANGAKGMRLILTPAAAKAIRSQQRRWQEPKPPPIQIMLKQARQLKIRLEQDPDLTRAALANEVGMNPSYLTRILNLLNLAPEIHSYILSLPPSQTKGPITESRIKHLARISNHEDQHREFNLLKNAATRRPVVTM
jgi:AraC-like DNA-binding protein